MRDKDKVILKHILSYCENIRYFIERFGNTYSAFLNDIAFQECVNMDPLQIGELAGLLSDDFREQTKNAIPWSNIKGLRNILAHDYARINYARIWDIANHDIPALAQFCIDEIERDNSVDRADAQHRSPNRNPGHEL